LNAETLAALEASDAARQLAARARVLTAPPTALEFEVLAESDACPCSLYEYNDLLIRCDPPTGLALDASVINAGRTYLQIDGYPAIGADLVANVPRVFMYGQSAYHAMLHLGDELAHNADARVDLNSCELYKMPQGEAKRHLVLLRRKWPHELEQGATHAPTGAERALPLVSARARCGSREDPDEASSNSSLPPPISQRSGSSRRDRPVRMPREAREQTLNALRCAAAVREDAGRVWPGGVPLAKSVTRPIGAAAAVDEDTLHALLGFPDAEDPLEA